MVLLACGCVAAACAQGLGVAGTMPEDQAPALKKLLESALRQSPSVLEKQLEIAVKEAQVLQADARRLPQLGFNGSFDQSQSAVSGSNSRRNRDSGVFYHAEASQALFHWNALKNESARARISVAMAEKNYQEAYRLAAADLRRQFLLLVAKKSVLLQIRDAQRLRGVALTLAKEKFADGLVAESAVTGASLAVEEGGLELERAEVEFTGLSRALARIAGVKTLTEAEIPADLTPPNLPPTLSTQLLNTLLRDGAKNAYQVQLQDMDARQAELSYKIAKVRLLPKFNTSAGHHVENTTNVTGGAVDQQGIERQTLSLRADWPIFDGFATRGAMREAAANKRLSEQRRGAVAEAIMEQAQNLQRQIAVEAEAVRQVDRRRALMESELGRVREEVERGNARKNLIDEKNSQVLLSVAASATARANLFRVWSEFVSTIGADPMLNQVSVRYARESR